MGAQSSGASDEESPAPTAANEPTSPGPVTIPPYTPPDSGGWLATATDVAGWLSMIPGPVGVAAGLINAGGEALQGNWGQAATGVLAAPLAMAGLGAVAKIGKQVKTLSEWLKDEPDLLNEARRLYKEAPEWQGIDPDTTPVFYRSKAEVDAIRAKPGESGGHHPHGLALGGPEGQTLTETGESLTVKNPNHSAATALQRRIINKIKNQ